MPLFEYKCSDCGKTSEILITGSQDIPQCSNCGGKNLTKLISAHASASGSNNMNMPGPGDSTCCGSSPGHSSCAGPGSCCGRN